MLSSSQLATNDLDGIELVGGSGARIQLNEIWGKLMRNQKTIHGIKN